MMHAQRDQTTRADGERSEHAITGRDAIEILLAEECSRAKLDQPAVEAAIMGLLLSDVHAGPWTRPEIERETSADMLTAADALVALHACGLIHLEGELVIASRAARAAQRMDALEL